MHAGTWKIINTINTVANEYVVMGYDPESQTPYGTWTGTIDGDNYDFVLGHYFKTEEEAYQDLQERAERFY